MPVQLLPSYTFVVDGYAINDFEALTVGPVTNLNFGVQEAGGVTWGDTILLPPRGGA